MRDDFFHEWTENSYGSRAYTYKAPILPRHS
jgi:hypothetical protein